MFVRAVDTLPVHTRRLFRVLALALAALMLVTACATGPEYRPPVPHDLPETWALESEADEDQGEALFARLPTDFAPVQVSDAEFSTALSTFWLDTPLRVATSRSPLYVGRRLALASTPLRGYAAVFLLSERPEQAKPVLEEAAKGEGLIPFEASQALKHWNTGTWSLDVD